MKRKRWIRITVICAGVLLIVAVGAYVAMDMVVDRALRQIASVAADGGRSSEKPGNTGSVADIPAEEPLGEENESPSGAESHPNDGGKPEASSGRTSPESSVSPAANDSETGEGSSPDTTERPANSSGNDDDQPSDLTAYTPDISSEKTDAVQDRVTPSEKLAVTSVLLKRFSVSDLRKFAALAGDGISVEDKKAVRKEFVEKLGEEEYNRLIAIAAKYGLSEGKSYAEVLKEEEKSGGG